MPDGQNPPVPPTDPKKPKPDGIDIQDDENLIAPEAPEQEEES